MIELLKFIGLKINILKKKIQLKIKNINKNIKTLASYKLVKTMRAGVLVLGPILELNIRRLKFHFLRMRNWN